MLACCIVNELNPGYMEGILRRVPCPAPLFWDVMNSGFGARQPLVLRLVFPIPGSVTLNKQLNLYGSIYLGWGWGIHEDA